MLLFRLAFKRCLATSYSESTVAQVLKLTNCIQTQDWAQVDVLSADLPEALVHQCFSSRLQDWIKYTTTTTTTGAIPTSIAMRFLAVTEDPLRETFQYVVRTISQGGTLDHQLVESYVWNLLANERMSVAATLLNMVLCKTTVTLSDELWGVLMSKICELADYPGAVIVYHHILQDPKHTPFLVNPHILESLLQIFATHDDYTRCQGIMAYFDAFYSLHLHPTTYLTLKTMLVESSTTTDFITSLNEFRSLCLVYKGHTKLHWHYHHHVLKNAGAQNYHHRRRAIAENSPVPSNDDLTNLAQVSDILPQELQYASETKAQLYDPIFERNVESTAQSNHVPLVDGVLRTSDTPKFYAKFHQHILTLVDNETGTLDLVETLRQRVIKTHYMLTVCVVRLLCELGKFQEALMLMETLGDKSMNHKTAFLIKEENFYVFGRTCDNYHLLIGCLQFYMDSTTKHHFKLSPKVIATFVTAIANHPLARTSDLEHFLALYWKFGKDTTIKVPTQTWDILAKKVDIKRFPFITTYIDDL